MNSAFDPDGLQRITDPAGAADLAEPADTIDAVDTGTIAWLLPEIVAAFDTANTALRAFRAGAAGVGRTDVDLAPLRIARAQLHQAHGALELGEVAGVTKLTEAIEDLLACFEREPERCDATALDAINGGCRTIVEYLEDLQSGARQQPLHLFPSYRDLLTTRGVDRIHPADLFLVDLGVRVPRSATGSSLDDAALREQRSTFEQALLRYIRNDGDAKALNALCRAVTAIDGSVASNASRGNAQHRAFWWATRALFEALAHDGFRSKPAEHAHIKRLAGRVNLQIRKLVDGSIAVAERLFTDTLFFVALSEPVTPHVREVQTAYRLRDAVPPDYEAQRYGRIDPAALRAARESLGHAKIAWSGIVAGDIAQIRSFTKHTGALVEAVGPIKRRGLAQVAQVIDGIAADLDFDPRRPSAGVGLDVATALLFVEGSLERARRLDSEFDARAALVVARVEASVLGQAAPVAVDWLDRMSREAEERLTLDAFVAELQANLRSAEKVLDAFFRDPTRRTGLKDAQQALTQVGGALSLLGHEEVHKAIDHVRESVARFERDDTAVDVAAFEQLAQSLGAVGFYVEQIGRAKIDTGAFSFDAESGRFSADMARAPVAASAADDRDAAIDDTPVATPTASGSIAPIASVERAPEPPVEMSYDDDFAATQVLDHGATLEDEIAQRAADAQDHAAALRQRPADDHARRQLTAAVDDVRRNAMLIDDRALHDEAAAVLDSLRERQHEPLGIASAADLADRVAALAIHSNRAAGRAPASVEPLEPATPVPSADNVDAIDAELLEIFLEEASGVLTDAGASMRVLDGDPHSTTAGTDLRRGFHTLKGSGRMVGLFAFGDAAWSIEETLNDHIADQQPASADLRALIDYAIRDLGAWVDELRVAGQSARIPDALIEAAGAVRKGSPFAGPANAVALASTSAAALEGRDAARRTPQTASSQEDAFLQTVFMPRGTSVPPDLDFAATQVIGDGSEASDVEFFGEQPHRPADAVPTVAAGRETIDQPLLEALDFSAFGIESTEPRADETIVPAPSSIDALDEGVADHGDPSLEGAVGPVSEAHVTTPAGEPVLNLDFGVEDALSAEAVLEAISPDVAPAAPGAKAAVVPPSTGVVIAFPYEPQVPRADEVRQIGSLTLSVALFNIYLNEADELLRVLTQDFAEWRHELDRFVSEGAMRAAHSLAGSSATVGLVAAHDLAAGIEEVLQALWREPVVLRVGQVERLQEAVESLRRMLHRFAAERLPEPDPVRIAGLLAMRQEILDDEAVAHNGREAADAGVEAPVAVELPFASLDFGDDIPSVPSGVENVDEAVGASSSAKPFEAAPPIDEVALTDELPIADEFPGTDEVPFADEFTVVDELPSTDKFADTDEVVESPSTGAELPEPTMAGESERLHDMPLAADRLVDDIESIAVGHDASVDPAAVVDDEVRSHEALDAGDEPPADAEDVLQPAGTPDFAGVTPTTIDSGASSPRRSAVVETVSTVQDDIDPDLLDIFVIEGGEILPQIGTLLRVWQADPAVATPSRALLRHLHTLKGSARMAGAMRLGEVVHDIEARVESAARLHDVPSTLLEELLAAHDRSLELFDALQRPVAEAALLDAVPTAPETTDASDAAVATTGGWPAIERRATPRVRDQKQASQPSVRVNSETLDRLVNLAGEVSISRARIENEVLQIKGAMSDLNDNVERLRGQLREIEMQAEFQMQSQMQSQQTSGQEREKFDPLEFDRFTRFQELTRMMAESVNDVKTVQQHLQKNLDAAETDLASQRRMTRDLQQDLMSVRMVPFSSIAERLYRVARRTAKELDKRVNLDIRGGSVEIDRSVLERMAGPFEHLLRNHIVHGIESREARRVSGKDETGELLVEVRQEGNEIVLTFSDDGAGLDYARIRAKGLALGLIAEHGVSDAQVAELIFHPGFSTAAEVTELAGRGVGMDVVRAEALVLAGRVSVDSEGGRGTRFTINLPLTLAITQVVLVAVAGRVYALPAVLVEQVQQLRPQPLADAYRAGHLAWAGSQVRLAFLGTLLGIDDSVPVAQRTSPVLVLRSAGERIAIHVDEVVGNQEVVVKNLGPQLARMTGIAGATVLGSGQIVLILNPVQLAAMTRAHEGNTVAHETAGGSAHAQRTVAGAEPQREGLKTLPTVMVVDDSLTVRRVTQRLLSREGYQVVLAKDGIDALEQLQDFPPDAMLVDIEMPRMDGFDLTRNVRNDERYKHIPIIIITSRTAEKHRRHAAELGVDAYLGKPYQEDELLELLAAHVRSGRTLPA